MLLPPHWPMDLHNCQRSHWLNPVKRAKIQLLAKWTLRMQTEMVISGETQTCNQSFPLQIVFFPVLFAAQFFQHIAGTASRELLSLPTSLCISYSMFYTWIWPLFRSHFCLQTTRTGRATEIISPFVPLPALSLMSAQAWLLLHTRL